jgi:hypothetical protein
MDDDDMPRIRSITPDWWSNPRLRNVDPMARLLLIGLANEADDDGRLRYLPRRFLGTIFPHDVIDTLDVERWLDALIEARLLAAYEVDGERFVRIVGWHDQQRINRPTPSKLPPDPAEPVRERSLSTHGALTESSLKPHGGLTAGSEGKGREGRGEEGKGIAREAPHDHAVATPPETIPDPSASHVPGPAALVSVADVVRGVTAQRSVPHYRPPRPRGVVGMVEAAAKPDVNALVARLRNERDVDQRFRFPALDGRAGRPTLHEVVTALWFNFEGNYDEKGPDVAYAKLITWVSKEHDRHRAALRADQRAYPTTTVDSAAPCPATMSAAATDAPSVTDPSAVMSGMLKMRKLT